MKNNKLQSETWDSYLMESYLKFLRTEGNYIQIGKGKCLKPGVKYRFTDAPNRNPQQVPRYMWKHLIVKHFIKYHYN